VIETICAFSRYFVAQFFGGIVAAGFCNMKETKKNYAVFSLYTVFIFIIQLICLNAFGMDLTLKIYPLISHLPIFLFVVFYLKKSWNVGLVSFATAFLCCQPLKIRGHGFRKHFCRHFNEPYRLYNLRGGFILFA